MSAAAAILHTVPELCDHVLRCAAQVNDHLFSSVSEHVYGNALEVELQRDRSVFHNWVLTREVPVAIRYHEVVVGHGRIDLLLELSPRQKLIVELKRGGRKQSALAHTSQLRTYVQSLRHDTADDAEIMGLLIWFADPMEHEIVTGA